jgi:subtilisin family serine protease
MVNPFGTVNGMALDLCKERILSEDYFDFIISDTLPPALSNIPIEQLCEQSADFGYRCVYVPRVLLRTNYNSNFSYRSIPHCYSLLSMDALHEAGILQIQNYPTLQLKGNGILLGFLDSGIDYTNSVFRNLDGSTRIAAIWDQSEQTGIPPEQFAYGSEYREDIINEALLLDNPRELVPTTDEVGHGTYVASVAAGRGDGEANFLGAAPESTIAVVKLKQAKQSLQDHYYVPADTPCYAETDILLALKYLNDLATELGLPLVICVALGTNLGGHTNLSALATVLDMYSNLNCRIPVIGTGNEADQRHHFSHMLGADKLPIPVEIRVGEGVDGFVLEFWTDIPNILSLTITSPTGETTNVFNIHSNASSTYNFIFERTLVEMDFRVLVEKSTSEMIFFRFNTPAAGIWKITVTPIQTISDYFHFWLPVSAFLSGEVYFLNADPYYTLTNPGNATNPIVVSYYNGSNDGVALSSGRGYTRNSFVNPDITAPGIDIKGALPHDRYAVRSGSSGATGLCAGATALLLEWVLYHMGTTRIDAHQLKSLLIFGAVRPNSMTFPNQEWGYGQLNLYNTLEEVRRL